MNYTYFAIPDLCHVREQIFFSPTVVLKKTYCFLNSDRCVKHKSQRKLLLSAKYFSS